MDSTLLLKTSILVFFLLQNLNRHQSTADLIAEPVEPSQPLRPVGGGGDLSSPDTVPAFPVQTGQAPLTCQLDLSDELFGGVQEACGHTLDRSRCCPVLAAWLFAAHARSALQISPPDQSPSPSPSPSPTPSPPTSSSSSSDSDLLPMMPDDSQKCVNSLQASLQKRSIVLAQPNASCDTVLCFCGIRLHQITSLSCPAAFNLTPAAAKGGGGEHRNATPTAAVKNLEKSCKNSSYAGCTKCLGALQKLKGTGKNSTAMTGGGSSSSRLKRMFNRDCQLMGLTWLLARNKTEYIPTVSAVLRALMYSSHPHESKCSPDQENMPLAVDSLQFDKSSGSHPTTTTTNHAWLLFVVVVLVLWHVDSLVFCISCSAPNHAPLFAHR